MERRGPSPTERSALFGISLYRVVTAAWAVLVALVDARSGVLVSPSTAFAILGPLLAWSVFTLVLSRRAPTNLMGTPAQVVDLAFGVAVVAAEWITYDGDHPLRFGAMWQLAPVIAAGLRFGTVGGLAAGTGLGLVNALALVAVEGPDGVDGRVLATLSAVVLLGVAGAASGAILDRLRRAEDDLAEARSRERVARTLHDGVLQTLAVIQRRSDDAALVELAAEQDRDLRRWIRSDFHDHPDREDRGEDGDLLGALHQVASELRRREGIAVEVVAVGSPRTSGDVRDALVGAVGEAVTNASKHGRAGTVTVFVDEDGENLTCSVNDDGAGFDEDGLVPGFGITTSIRAPVERLGGDVSISAQPGVGSRVELRIPLGPRRPNRAARP